MKKFALFAMLLCAGIVGCAEKKADEPKKDDSAVTKPEGDATKTAEPTADAPK